MSMAGQAAHLWSVASLFLASAGNPGGAHLLAVAQPARARCRTLHSADAKGPDPNECATAHCLERSERSEWASDHPRLAGGRARSKSLGAVARFTLSGQRRGDGAKFAGELERGPFVRTAASRGRLRLLPPTNAEMRPATTALHGRIAYARHGAHRSIGLAPAQREARRTRPCPQTPQTHRKPTEVRARCRTGAHSGGERCYHRRHRRHDHSDRIGGSGTRFECLENGTALDLLAKSGSQAGHQWRPRHSARSPTPHQPRWQCLPHGRPIAGPQSKLFRSPLPIFAGQVGRTESRESNGTLSRLSLLSTAHPRTDLGGSGYRRI